MHRFRPESLLKKPLSYIELEIYYCKDTLSYSIRRTKRKIVFFYICNSAAFEVVILQRHKFHLLTNKPFISIGNLSSVLRQIGGGWDRFNCWGAADAPPVKK